MMAGIASLALAMTTLSRHRKEGVLATDEVISALTRTKTKLNKCLI